MSISVVIAEPASVQRDAVVSLVTAAPDEDVVAVAGSREGAGEILRQLSPQVAVVDVCLLSFSDFLFRGWGPVYRDTRVIAVGLEDSRAVAAFLVAKGAAQYVCRARVEEQLCEAIRKVAGQGRGWGD
jgi:DNA-binding NarL/FixJ family response regulator